MPGYVFLSLRNQFVAGQAKLGKEQLLSYLTVSGVNFALCGWIIYAAYKGSSSVRFNAFSWMQMNIPEPGYAAP